jgi:putative DNA primase/helicase
MNESLFVVLEGGPAEGNVGSDGASADQARLKLAAHVGEMMRGAINWHEGTRRHDDFNNPPHFAVRVTTGLGKSHALRQEIAKFVTEMKRRGLPHRVLYLIPTHALGDEARLKMPSAVTTALWQGRKAINLQTSEPLCQNLEAVKTAEKIGAEVESTACKQGRGDQEIKCPFYDVCGYQTQKPTAKQADVVFAAHEFAFLGIPPSIVGEGFGLVVIDEGFWQDGLHKDQRIAVDRLAHELDAFPVLHRGSTDIVQTADLRTFIACLQDGLQDQPDGYVTKAPLLNAGLVPTKVDPKAPGSGRRAARFEWRRKVESYLRPDSTHEDLQAAAKKFQFIGQLPRRAAMWRMIDKLISGDAKSTGWLRLETETTNEGSVRYLHVSGRKDIDTTILNLPIIHADATMQIEVVKYFLPNVVMALDLDVAAPHETVTQLFGWPVGKASLEPRPPGKRSQEEEERVARKRQTLVDFVRHVGKGRRTLVIAYKSIEDAFKDIPGVETTHWGAFEGIDRWGKVAVIVTIGRPLPGSKALEHMTAALTGQPITAGDAVKDARNVRLKSGAAWVMNSLFYENAEVDVVRKAITEAAMVQGVGRGRGINRDAGNKLEVFIVNHDTPYPGLLDEVVAFQDVKPDKVDEMIARGLVPAFPGDAAKLYPDLFKNRDAAKQAYHRAGLSGSRLAELVTTLNNIILRDVTSIRFRASGRGQTTRTALVDFKKVPNPRDVLESALGPLAEYVGPATAVDAARLALIAAIQNRAAALAAIPVQAVAA